MIDRQLVVISRAGEPVPRALSPQAPVIRQGRGSLRGRIRISAAFDEPRAGIAEAFGMR
ncbi:hypothetical protein AB0G71_00385 [Streptomyces sp. NPDC020403]|uniref:hypothetical protein n=1 Tax=unclassified Streptomyces TaxID=2593676 RepID=UPI0033DF284B